jgi:hypothetical protein
LAESRLYLINIYRIEAGGWFASRPAHPVFAKAVTDQHKMPVQKENTLIHRESAKVQPSQYLY